MTHQKAPYAYIQEYYDKRVERRRRYPDARLFYESQLKNVVGSRIVNIGCGPQFYDDLRHFGETPQHYIGLDLNPQNLEFVKHSTHRELLEGKSSAEKKGVRVELVCGDLLDEATDLGPEFDDTDCVVSVGFLGIFTEQKFKAAIERIGQWLRPQGRLVNLSWCGNHQNKALYEERLRYQFNHADNPEHDDIKHWTQEAGLLLVKEDLYEVPDKALYGWATISACVFEKPSA